MRVGVSVEPALGYASSPPVAGVRACMSSDGSLQRVSGDCEAIPAFYRLGRTGDLPVRPRTASFRGVSFCSLPGGGGLKRALEST